MIKGKRQPEKRSCRQPRLFCGRRIFYAGVCALAAGISLILAFCFFSTPGPDGPAAAANAAENKLPLLCCGDPVYFCDNDAMIGAADRAAGDCYLSLRSSYGAPSASRSEALSKAAAYAAVSALVSESDAGDAAAGAEPYETCISSALDMIPSVSGFVYCYFNDYSSASAALSARFAINSIKNAPDGLRKLIDPEARSYGAAFAVRNTASGNECCFVLVYAPALSENAENAIGSMIPGQICESGEFCSGPYGKVCDADVYVRKGGSISAADVSSSCGVRDRTGALPSVRFDASSVNTQKAGAYSLNVAVSLGSHTVGKTLSVLVVDAALTSVPDETVTVPSVPPGEIDSPAAYIGFSAQSGLRGTVSSPLFVSAADEPKTPETPEVPETPKAPETPEAPETSEAPDAFRVRAFFADMTGRVLQKELTVQFEKLTRVPVRPAYTDNKGLNVNVREGTTLFAGNPSLISFGDVAGSGEDGCVCVFRLTLPGGRILTTARTGRTLLWKPTEYGMTAIDAFRYDASGNLLEAASIKIDVAKSDEVVYNEPVLTLTEGRVNVRETEEGVSLLCGIAQNTGIGAVSELISVSGGIMPEIALFGRDGSTPAEDALFSTGMTVRVTDGDRVLYEFVIIITGDVNGDGKVGIGDFSMLRQQLLKGGIVNGIYVYAADLNGDGSIGIGDFAKLRQFLLGRIELD